MRKFLAFLCAIGSLCAVANGQVFSAYLDSENQTPPIPGVEGFGECSTYPINSTTWGYNITLVDLHDVTLAHFHYGNSTTSGPVVVPLLALTVPLSINGEAIFQSTFTAANLTATLAGKGFSALETAIDDDLIYCNIHTTQYPEGMHLQHMLCHLH